MATSVQDFLKKNPNYIGRSNTANRTVAAPAQKPRGGLAGFIENIVRDVAHPVGYVLDADIGNPIRQLAAQATGNDVAYRNAGIRANKNLGLGEKGTDFTGGLKTWAGNSAQLGLTFAAPAAKSVKGAAAAGAGFGGSSALAHNRPWEEVATQAAIGGATGGALKGATTVGNKLLGRGGSQVATEGSGASSAAQRLYEKSAGLKLSGSVGNVGDNKLASDIYLNHGLTGTPRQILAKTPATMTKLNSEVEGILSSTPHKLPGKTVVSEIQKMAKNPSSFSELELGTPAAQKALELHLDQISKLNGGLELNNYVKTINPVAIKARDALYSGRTLTAKQSAALAVKEGIDTSISNISDDIMPLKQAMAVMFKRTPEITDAANKGVTLPFGAGRVPGAKFVAEGTRGIGTKIAGALQGTGTRAPSKLAGALGGVPKMGLAAYPVTGLSAIRSPGQAPTETEEEDTTLYGPEAVRGYSDGGALPPEDATPQTAYSLQQALADLQAHPDAKSRKNIMDYYDFVQSAEKAQGGGQQKPLNQNQQERADLINALGMTENVIDQGSINYGPIGSRLEGVKGIFNKADPETLDFKNTVSGLRAAITKARAGASLTAGELKMLSKYTPSDTDSEQVVRAKLKQLRALYGYSAPQGGGDDLSSLISQAAY